MGRPCAHSHERLPREVNVAADRKAVVYSPQGLQGDRLLPFTCLGSSCPNTCCGPFHGTRALEPVLSHADLGSVLGTDSDVGAERISIFAQIRLTESDMQRLQSAGLDHLITRRGDITAPQYYMKLDADGSCAALAKDGLCSIHPNRPTICRAFPFYIDLFAGLSMVGSCPGVGSGEQTVEKLRPEIDAAVDMYEFWLQQLRLKAATPPDNGPQKT